MLICLKKYIKAVVAGAAVICIAALLLLFFATKQQCLALQLDGQSRSLAVYPMADGAQFSISFIHSVNQTEVREYYTVQSGKIYLTSCVYSSLGAGVATEIIPPARLTTMPDGTMQITGLSTYIPRLTYVVGTVSDHTLFVDNQEISLTQLCGKNAEVSFTVIQARLF